MATVAVCVLFYSKDVMVKLLPFDNKSEMSVVLDADELRSKADACCSERTG